jgi:4-amino-4-deoxy-L-arabinose transferase-like glycosyltransferase
MPRKIPRLLWLALPMAYLLYFHALGAKGMLGPDEPRYAAISQEMARSGDWITPRLWGRPWFEKPALLYWMQGAAFRSGLGPDLAPRLPVALLAVAFLALYWWMLRREFGQRPAWLATLILGTCAGWIGFSQVGVTDLPLTVTFSTAVLLVLPWIAKGGSDQGGARLLPAAAAFLGLAVLAKSLVPLALSAPLILYYRRWRDLLRARVILPLLAIALPWYILCYMRNGRPFLTELFWKHQFQRVVSTTLMHVQPWWFYVPVFLGLLLPWSPLLPALARFRASADPRRRFLLILVVWGFIFFSIPINKLPGYLLPLFPAAAALLGLALDEMEDARPWLAACAALLVVFPIAAAILPAAVAGGGLSKATWPQFQIWWLAPLAMIPAVWILEARGLRLAAAACIAAGVTAGAVYLKQTAPAALDATPSARVLWREVEPRAASVCLDHVDNSLQFGLNYYAHTDLPECADDPKPVRVRQAGKRPYVAE